MHDLDNEKSLCGYDYYGDEFSPLGMRFPLPDPFDIKKVFKSVKPVSGFPPFRDLVDHEIRKTKKREIGVVNELNPTKYNLNMD